MRLHGYMYDVEGLEEYAWDIKEAVITDSRIALDWDENGEILHALLHSTDGGTHYEGTFGSPSPESGWVMKAIRFQANNGQVLLWLNWNRRDRGNGGVSIVLVAASWGDY